MNKLKDKTFQVLGLVVLAGVAVILGILQPIEMLMNGNVGLAVLQALVVWTYVGGRLDDNDR